MTPTEKLARILSYADGIAPDDLTLPRGIDGRPVFMTGPRGVVLIPDEPTPAWHHYSAMAQSILEVHKIEASIAGLASLAKDAA